MATTKKATKKKTTKKSAKRSTKAKAAKKPSHAKTAKRSPKKAGARKAHQAANAKPLLIHPTRKAGPPSVVGRPIVLRTRRAVSRTLGAWTANAFRTAVTAKASARPLTKP